MTHLNKHLEDVIFYKFQHTLILLWYLKLCTGELITSSDNEINNLLEKETLMQIPIKSDRKRYTSPKEYAFFNCQSNGKFKDIKNSNSYWYCDISPDGSFIAIRRSCPVGYIFSQAIRQCVSRSDRRCGSKFQHKSPVSYIVIVTESTTDIAETTTCLNTTANPSNTTCSTTTTSTGAPLNAFTCESEGAFPDPKTCRSFYICHRKRKSQNSYEKIRIKCPKGMVFNKQLNWCSRQSNAYKNNKHKHLDSLLHVWRVANKEALHDHSTYKNNIKNLNPRRISKGSENCASNYIIKRHITDNTFSKQGMKLHNKMYGSKEFQCFTKGIFPDLTNQNKYYICYKKELSPGYIKLNMKCPKNTLFDITHLSCFFGK